MKVEYPKLDKLYEHYKGGIYQVITMCNHTETKEPLVICKSLLFGSVYARPLSTWFELIELENKLKVPRFVLYKPE